METLKKSLVLGEITEGFAIYGKSVSGIARVEKEAGGSVFSLSLVNLLPTKIGSFYAAVSDGDGNFYYFDLGKNPCSITKKISGFDKIDGVSAGLVLIDNGLPVLIAFCRENNPAALSPELFKKAVIDKCISEKKKEIRQSYDDEIVATENYYLYDRELKENLDKVEKLDDGILRNETDDGTSVCEKTQEKNFPDDFEFSYEKTSAESQKYDERNPYFNKVKSDLDDIFFKFPPEDDLNNTVPQSKWAKISYSGDKYYVVGIINENDKEKYICYGVPDVYSEVPPEQLKGYCSFIPLSVFDLKGKGYWMMFQDAVTGECVRKDGQ